MSGAFVFEWDGRLARLFCFKGDGRDARPTLDARLQGKNDAPAMIAR